MFGHDWIRERMTELVESNTQLLRAKHYGVLYLSGLNSLSDHAANALSKHEGFLYLDGLASLSDAAAEVLSKHQSVMLSDVTAGNESESDGEETG